MKVLRFFVAIRSGEKGSAGNQRANSTDKKTKPPNLMKTKRFLAIALSCSFFNILKWLSKTAERNPPAIYFLKHVSVNNLLMKKPITPDKKELFYKVKSSFLLKRQKKQEVLD